MGFSADHRYYFFFSFLVDKVANIGFVKVVYLYLEGLSDNVADMGYFLELPESFFLKKTSSNI